MDPMARVIKNEQVRMAGPRRLDQAEFAAGNGLTGTRQTGDALTDTLPTQAAARIVEMGPTSALIEVTCPCGQKSYVRCDYQA